MSSPGARRTRARGQSWWPQGVLLILVLVSPPAADALNPKKAISQYSAGVWSTAQGLPQNSVETLLQSRDGYLWLGTQEGLARFDGVRFTVFDSGNTAAITNNHIVALLEARDGTLWIGTFGGGLVTRRGRVFETVPEMGDGAVVNVLAQDSAGAIWVGTADAGVTRLGQGPPQPLTVKDGLPSNQVAALLAEPDGSVWIGTASGLACFRAGQLAVFTTRDGLSDNGVTAILRDRSGRLFVGTEVGLDVLGENGRFVPASSRSELARTSVRCLAEDRHGGLWIGATRTLLRLLDERLEALTTNEWLPGNSVVSLLQDQEGSLWVGTDGAGVARLKDGKVTAFTRRQGLPSNSTYAVVGDRGTGLWVATYSAGIAHFDGKAFTRPAGAEGVAGARIRALHAGRSGDLWIGTDQGLYRLKRGHLTLLTTAHSLPDNTVRVVHEDRLGRLWVGTDGGGLAALQHERVSTFNQNDGLAGDQVRAILEAPNGVLWVATLGGLSRLQDGQIVTYRAAQGLSSTLARSLYLDGDGVLWVGTYGGGLNRFKDGKFAAIRRRDGLLSDVIYSILEDERGNLWMSCNKGIFEVSKKSIEQFLAGRIPAVPIVAYDESDGMESRECNGGSPGGSKMSDGRLVFPTLGGIVVVDPDETPRNTVPPPVVIEDVVADEASIASGAVLAPGAKRFVFQYTALSFVAPQEVRFAYRLEGVDPGWVESSQRVSSYSHLPPGRYRFRVKAANEDGAWNEEGASFEFTLRPHFYETTLFQAGLILGLVVVVGAGAGLRLRHHHRREEELERRVQEGLTRIKVLSGLLPICAWCKKVRDDRGYWSQIETYIRDRTEADFTHGICPECLREVAPEAAENVGPPVKPNDP